MIRCSQCGRENPDGSRFCNYCGARLEESTFSGTIQEERTFTGTIVIEAGGGRFRDMELLGEGGMGRVYKAYDEVLEEWVVLKTLPMELRKDSRLLERFFREAKIGRKLSHPHIVRVYDLYDLEGVWYLAMEYVEGRDLKGLISSRGCGLEVEEVFKLVRQICEGLGYAHSQGIIHRDIKSSNILVSFSGVAKLSDFGIAKARELVGFTRSGERLGSPAYMSPEQFRGGEVDERSDIYSLGVVIFEMLTGRLPFEGDFSQLMRAHLELEPPRLKDLREDVPGIFQVVLDRCLAKRRDDRYERVEDILVDLRGYLEGGEDVSWSGYRRVRGEFEPFEFKELGEKAYDERELFELIRRHPDEAGKYLEDGSIERWLDYLGADELRDRVKELREVGGDYRAGALELVEGRRPYILRRGELVWDLDELLKAFGSDIHEGRYQLYQNTDRLCFWLEYIGEKEWAEKARKIKEKIPDRKIGLNIFLEKTGKALKEYMIKQGIEEITELLKEKELDKASRKIEELEAYQLESFTQELKHLRTIIEDEKVQKSVSNIM